MPISWVPENSKMFYEALQMQKVPAKYLEIVTHVPMKHQDAGVNPHHLKQLEKLGYLVRAPGNSRNWYKVVKPMPVCSGVARV